MDLLFGILYLLFFSVVGWALYRRDCKLSLFLLSVIIVLITIEAGILIYYRRQGMTYPQIFNHLISIH